MGLRSGKELKESMYIVQNGKLKDIKNVTL